jgi:hypothetical protein
MTRTQPPRPDLPMPRRDLPMPRRDLLTLAGGLLAAPLLPAVPALAAGGFALAPDYRVGWAVQKTSAKARILQIADGVRADTPAKLADIDTGALALWSRQKAAGDWTVAFGYRVLSRLSDPGGTFCCFYLNGIGEGSARYPLDISRWKNIRPSDTVYFRHSRGLRFSFATANPDPKADFPPGQLRLRYYERSNGPLVLPNSPVEYPFTTGVPYLVAVTRKGSTLTVAVTDQNTSEKHSHTWTDARIALWYDGRVGFRWRGQDANVTGLTYSQL